jgi:hypothetical protein
LALRSGGPGVEFHGIYNDCGLSVAVLLSRY